MKSLLLIVSVVLLASIPAIATTSWSVDFESGFTASSGSAHTNNAPAEVHVEADPVDAQNNALDVDMIDTTFPRSLLAYTGMDYTPTASSGRLDVRWMYNGFDQGQEPYGNWYWNRNPMLFTMTDGTPTTQGDEYIGFYLNCKPSTGVWQMGLNVYDNLATPEEPDMAYTFKQWDMMPLAAGWHDFTYEWQSLGFDASEGKVMARINLWVDGTQVLTNGTQGWGDFETNMITVGCRWFGSSAAAAAQQVDAGERGDLMDDVNVTIPEPCSILLLLGGAMLIKRKR
jgi:hypothetical protein